MSKFTKIEIELCKQVAERHRKEIEYGDWYWSSAYPKILLAMDYGFKPNEQEFAGVFKIWTISDCLEWLMTKGTDCGVFYDPKDEIWKGYLTIIDQNCIAEKGKTPLEACLKAVLAVLGEGGKP